MACLYHFGFTGSKCFGEKYRVPVSLWYTELKGERKMAPCDTLFNKPVHLEDHTRLTGHLKDKYWIHMQGYFKAFLFMHIKTQMSSDYLK